VGKPLGVIHVELQNFDVSEIDDDSGGRKNVS